MTSRSMTSDSWPNGVVTESDNCKFLNLLFANAPRKDLTKSLPTWWWDDASGIFKSCFLTFVRRIHDVNDLKMIEVSFNIFNDQQKWEASNGHMSQVAHRIHDIQGSKKATRYYRQPSMATIAIAGSALEGTTSGKKPHAQGQPMLISMAKFSKIV